MAAIDNYKTASKFVWEAIAEMLTELDGFDDPHLFECVGKFAIDLFQTLPRGNNIDIMKAMEYTNSILTRLGDMRGKMLMMILRSDPRFDDVFVPKINNMIISWCNRV